MLKVYKMNLSVFNFYCIAIKLNNRVNYFCFIGEIILYKRVFANICFSIIFILTYFR
jgi:hypothetical protein